MRERETPRESAQTRAASARCWRFDLLSACSTRGRVTGSSAAALWSTLLLVCRCREAVPKPPLASAGRPDRKVGAAWKLAPLRSSAQLVHSTALLPVSSSAPRTRTLARFRLLQCASRPPRPPSTRSTSPAPRRPLAPHLTQLTRTPSTAPDQPSIPTRGPEQHPTTPHPPSTSPHPPSPPPHLANPPHPPCPHQPRSSRRPTSSSTSSSRPASARPSSTSARTTRPSSRRSRRARSTACPASTSSPARTRRVPARASRQWRAELTLRACAQMVALSAAQGYAQVCGHPAAVIVHVDCGTQVRLYLSHHILSSERRADPLEIRRPSQAQCTTSRPAARPSSSTPARARSPRTASSQGVGTSSSTGCRCVDVLCISRNGRSHALTPAFPHAERDRPARHRAAVHAARRRDPVGQEHAAGRS